MKIESRHIHLLLRCLLVALLLPCLLPAEAQKRNDKLLGSLTLPKRY